MDDPQDAVEGSRQHHRQGEEAAGVSLGFCYARSDLEPSVTLDLVWRDTLSLVEFEQVAADLAVVRGAARRPMLEVIEGAHSSWAAAIDALLRNRSEGATGRPSVSLDREATLAAFATVNAVYGFQEHAGALARGSGQPAHHKVVDAIFREVYADNLTYLYAYKLRQIFVHASIGAIVTRDASRVTPEGRTNYDLSGFISTKAIRKNITGMVGQWLDGLATNVDLFDLMEQSLAGMEEVFTRTRNLLFPDLPAALTRLEKWRSELLNDRYPLCLARQTWSGDRAGPLALTQIRPDILRRVGMKPLSSAEESASAEAALARIQGVTQGPHEQTEVPRQA